MTVHDLQTLLDYHYWARDRVFEAIERLTPEQYNRDLGSSFKSIRETITHVYAAEWAWYMRWQGESPTALLTADRFADLAALGSAWRELQTKILTFVNGLDAAGTHRVIEYTLLNGQ